MDDFRADIFLLHHDDAWCARVTRALYLHGITSRTINEQNTISTADHSSKQQPACVLAHVSGEDTVTVKQVLSKLHRQHPNSYIIALLAYDNAALDDAAVHAGANECLPASADIVQLTVHVLDALASMSFVSTPQSSNATPPPGRLLDHGAFLRALGEARLACRRAGKPLSMLKIDLDRFRVCNEEHSPAFGDHVLEWLAGAVSQTCTESNLTTRSRGDRFMVAMPNATAAQATMLADRLRTVMKADPPIRGGRPYETSVSMGIVESSAGFIESEHQLIERVRAALEQAKRQGGGRTVLWKELLDSQPPRRHEAASGEVVSHWIGRLKLHLHAAYMESTRALVAAVEAKDPYTQSHSLKVAAYAEAIGRRLQLPRRTLKALHAAALLHDVGKIGIPDAILAKCGPLTAEEFTIMKRHPEMALDILTHVSFLRDERPMILHHHERFDGSGYPAQIAGDQIPIGARILAVADAIDTMLSRRTYKEPFSPERVRSELAKGRGSQFDPAVVDATLGWLDERPNDLLTGEDAPPAATARAHIGQV